MFARLKRNKQIFISIFTNPADFGPFNNNHWHGNYKKCFKFNFHSEKVNDYQIDCNQKYTLSTKM